MADAFQERQSELYEQIGSELIALMPAEWNAAVLELVHDPPRYGEGVALSINSPEGRKDYLFPTDRLYEAVYRLEKLFREQSRLWTRGLFEVRRDGDDWQFRVDYTYA